MTKLRMAGAIVAVIANAACNNAPGDVDAGDLLSADVTFESRGVLVPVTFVRPARAAAAPFPVVVMAHGHGGTRGDRAQRGPRPRSLRR